MSLTAHLRSKRSPIRAWLDEHFGKTRTFTRDANRELCQQAECPLPLAEGADSGLVGTGVDYLLRVCLRATALERTVASRGVAYLDGLSALRGAAGRAHAEATSQITSLQPHRRELSDEEWRQLCRYCLLLARFEQYFRSRGTNMAFLDLLVYPLEDWKDGLDSLINQTVPEPSVEDLTRLGRGALEDHRRLRRMALHLNPKFALSVELGGADADLIAGRTLFEWKATTTRRAAGRQEVWQLLGYVLADTYDHYKMNEVGIRAVRWRSATTWRLDEFLAGISESHPGPLPKLRIEFAELVTEVHAQQLARRAKAGVDRAPLPIPHAE